MSFHFVESRTSRGVTTEPPGKIFRFVATGTNDPEYVRAYAIQYTTGLIESGGVVLYRQDVVVEPGGFERFDVTVPYSNQNKLRGSYKLSYDTTGGTVHITQAKEPIARYPGTAADHQGAIGVGKDGDVQGTEIVVPALKIIVSFRHPLGVINLPHIFNLARWTGRTNSDLFFGRQPGEVLFLGSVGSEGSDSGADAEYHFAFSENLTNFSVAGISGISKKGFEHYWIEYKSSASEGKHARQPRAVYVNRVYDSVPLATALGFGG